MTRHRKHPAPLAAAVGLLVAVGGIACIAPFAASPAFGYEERKEGAWTVTTLGVERSGCFMEKEQRLLVACDGKPPELWDTAKGKRIAVLREHAGAVEVSVPSPDGKRIVTASALTDFSRPFNRPEEKVIRSLWVWETATGKLQKRIDIDLSAKAVRNSTDWQIEWRGNGELFLRIYWRFGPLKPPGQTVFALVDVEKGQLKRMTQPLALPGGLNYSPDRKRAVATDWYSVSRDTEGGIGRGGSGAAATVKLVDMERFAEIGTLDEDKSSFPSDDRRVSNTAWSPDGRLVATVRGDHTVGIWDGLTGKPVARLKGHTDWILSVRFSPRGDRVLTASDDDTARIWEATTGKLVATLTGHSLGLTDAAFDDRGERVVTGAEDQTARLWDARTGKQLRIFADHESGVRHVAFAAEGERIYTETARGVRRYWSARDGALLSRETEAIKPGDNWSGRLGVCYLRTGPGFPFNGGGVSEIWVGPPGATPPPDPPVPGSKYSNVGPISLSEDINTANLATPRITLKGHKSGVTEAAFAPDGKTLATLGVYDAVLVWKPAEWDRVTGRGRKVLARGMEARSLTFSPDGKTLLTGHMDGTVRLWDAATGQLRATHRPHRGIVADLIFMPDGKTLVSREVDVAAHVFEVKAWTPGTDGERLLVRREHASTLGMALSPDGRTLALAEWPQGEDGPAKTGELSLWDTATGKELRRIRGDGLVMRLAFTPDGKTLAAAVDKTVCLFDPATGTERAVLRDYPERIRSLAVSPDGKLVVTGDERGVVRFQDIAGGKTRATVQAHGRNAWVSVLALSPDGETLVSVDGDPKLWDVKKLLAPPGKK
jgi:WD40 repeat protein